MKNKYDLSTTIFSATKKIILLRFVVAAWTCLLARYCYRFEVVFKLDLFPNSAPP
jgi:hypothetical protein